MTIGMADRPAGKPFFDTNILIYTLASDDPRASVARSLLVEGGTIGVQVLNEFAAVTRRKIGLSWTEIGQTLAAILELCGPPMPMTLAVHEAGLRLAARYGYRIFDSLILAAALEARCDLVYSEDMQHGQSIEDQGRRLRVRDPFRQ